MKIFSTKKLFDFPDWHQGIDFGNPRTPDSKSGEKYTGITNTLQKKLDALSVKEAKIYEKLSKDKNAKFKARKHVMSPVQEVDGMEALSLISIAMDRIRKNKSDTGGIIIYV